MDLVTAAIILTVLCIYPVVYVGELRGGPFDNWGGGVEENVPEHFIYFFQEQRQYFLFDQK